MLQWLKRTVRTLLYVALVLQTGLFSLVVLCVLVLHAYNGVQRTRAELLQNATDEIKPGAGSNEDLTRIARRLGLQVVASTYGSTEFHCQRGAKSTSITVHNGYVTLTLRSIGIEVTPQEWRWLGLGYWQFSAGACEEGGRVTRVFKQLVIPFASHGYFSYVTTRTQQFSANEHCRNPMLKDSPHAYMFLGRAGGRPYYTFQAHQDEQSHVLLPGLLRFDLRCVSYLWGCGEANAAAKILPTAWKQWSPDEAWKNSPERVGGRRRESDCPE